jgi:hypothetical protein
MVVAMNAERCGMKRVKPATKLGVPEAEVRSSVLPSAGSVGMIAGVVAQSAKKRSQDHKLKDTEVEKLFIIFGTTILHLRSNSL